MNIEPKILNPICIKFGDNENIVLKDKLNDQDYPLSPGVMFGGEHYGFVLIIDISGKQKEIIYPTQCKIVGTAMVNGLLKIFEEDKKTSWCFNKKGNLEHSLFNEFTDEFKRKYDMILEDSYLFIGEPQVINPITIKIPIYLEESIILKDEIIKEDYPLCPGTMLGTIHYGIKMIIETDEGEKEVVFPTQNRIDSVGKEGPYSDIKVYENGKYHPWIFDSSGKLKEEASYNPFSKMDIDYVKKVYNSSINDAEERFTIKVKK